MQLRQRANLHTKTVNKLEKVKRNRTGLDIKSRFVFIYEDALVFHHFIRVGTGTGRVDYEVVKVHFVTSGRIHWT